MLWKHAPLRKVLLTALIILSACGLFAITNQAVQRWQVYGESKSMANGAYVANQMMTLAKNLAYERGRTAVVLRKAEPISQANINFINERRASVDLAIEKLRASLPSLPNNMGTSLLTHWPEIVAMRKQVDREKMLPLAQRAPNFVSRWVTLTSQFLENNLDLTENIEMHFRHDGKASRLIQLSFFALRLRLTAGLEASKIAQQVVSDDPVMLSDAFALCQMYGKHKEIWDQVQYFGNSVVTPKMKAKLVQVNQAYEALRYMQKRAFEAWVYEKTVDINAEELMALSIPVLDGISDVMILATDEARANAAIKMDEAGYAFYTLMFFAVIILLIMAMSIYYVMTRVVKPIEEIDAHLHHLNFSNQTMTKTHANEIERLRETVHILKETFKEKTRLEGELSKLAFYDPLTELPNRRLMMDRFEQKILRAKRDKGLLALLFIDLDEFKVANDKYGHEAGDWLLNEASGRMLSHIRASDTLARLGGDEFLILLPDLKTPQNAVSVAEKIRCALEVPFMRDNGQEMIISSSIGVAIFPDDGETEEELLEASNRAMFSAKRSGRNKVVASLR